MDQKEGDRRRQADSFLAIQEKADAANINRETLLATDYLNHFNEVVMTLEMIPDMPELLEEAREWRPKTYQDHFRASSSSSRDLAVEAYNHVPDRFRRPFERTINQINRLVLGGISKIEADLALGDPVRLRTNVTSLAGTLQSLLAIAGAIINGSEKTMDQDGIDALLD